MLQYLLCFEIYNHLN